MTKALRIPHHFTLPYCPCSNGAVERLDRKELRVAHALLSELQLRPDQWPDLLTLFQSALNQSPSPQGNNLAPVPVFTDLDPKLPIATFISSDINRLVTLSNVQRTRVFNIAELQQRISEVHPMVDCTMRAQSEHVRKAADGVELANFSEGKYVLVAREDFHKG